MKNSSVQNLDLFDRARAPTTLKDRNKSSNPTVSAPPAFTSGDIRLGLRNHESAPRYQPKLSLKNGTFNGAKVLVHWNHPELGELSPSQFLPAVQHPNLIEELFFEIFEQAMLLRRTLSAFEYSMGLAFNLEPSQLHCETFSTAVRHWLEQYQCPAGQITFEVTETGWMPLSQDCLKNLLRLRILGCNLSMNDFGTGFSSLEQLCDLPFNELKLEGLFVQRMHSHPFCQIVVENTIQLARTLGLSLVIEGVETVAQMKKLEALGCPIVQGFAIARPMPEQQFINYCLQYHAQPRKAPLCA
ncbi:EAL domain-containing protein (putative c-di-GMP-specific phosphodiesterase class I) [Pseudomonas fluorescens]|uniref:EAL domain-containing protein n=1 Tax=Pseudomonas fluorescens TaxID=294 RepID=UPI0020A03B24|nr:EAL domain-containing protein [Pseudomonas fluorescens]MCP1488439.1 EAL domain-containing protein (putative c-di-GMP-specific phosphodiesterase class I) [Pseudomonas fluorescens]